MTASFQIPGVSRRVFLGTATAAAGATLLPWAASAKAKYTRYNATSPQGQAMLASYAIAVGKMLELPPSHPHNWFRNAFVHAMDCPHGNWWFFDWHRPYLGYFEQTVRALSGNPDFAIPYWDWTQKARIPEPMFNGVLDPTNLAYDKYTSSYDAFYKYLNPAMTDYWKGLSAAQLDQLKTRSMPTLESLWAQVKGNPKDGAMFVTRPYARYLSKANPWLDAKTRKEVAPFMVTIGLRRRQFSTFNSAQTTSHNLPPSGPDVFGILEGHPHNKTHNDIGGVNDKNLTWVNYGFMADNLSPVDPVFFLHHSNMDRLWDVWTRKQQALHLPYLPTGADWATFAKEPFLFYVDGAAKPAPRTGGDSVNIGAFDYDYQPGFGEELVEHPPVTVAAAAANVVGTVSGGAGAVQVPSGLAAGAGTLVASVTIPHPMSGAAPREYDVLVNAPPGTGPVSADSPYYAGTISFFGFMPGMMGDVTFQIPLEKLPPAAKGAKPGQLVFTVVPSKAAPVKAGGVMAMAPPAPLLKSVTVSVAE